MTIMYGEQGHGRAMLYRDGVTGRPLVHRLVLEAFDRAPVDGEQGCHINGDAKNNALWNLRWGSQSDNWDDRKRHGNRRSRQWAPDQKPEWPLRSVWLGVSVENQEAADDRIPELLATPAAVRFLSCEPLLGPLDLTGQRDPATGTTSGAGGLRERLCATIDGDLVERPRLDWIIAGCESGPGARTCEVSWLRSLRDQCAAAGVPYFLKQAVCAQEDTYVGSMPDGSRFVVTGGPGSKKKGAGIFELPYLDGVQHAAFPEISR
jgi:hypothetical protein